MRCGLLLGLTLVFATTATAQSNWFTVSGNPGRVDVDTVQVDPVAVARDPEGKTMNIRVSRAALRHNWEGIPYRSYDAQVVFRCGARTAEYVNATFYMEPLWRGVPHQATDYSTRPPSMLFKDAQPNPTQRIIRAACGA